MYQPHPQSGEMPPDPTRPDPPRPVRIAVLFMYTGAALSAVSLIVTVLSSTPSSGSSGTRRPR